VINRGVNVEGGIACAKSFGVGVYAGAGPEGIAFIGSSISNDEEATFFR
jgi:hypothetical protein